MLTEIIPNIRIAFVEMLAVIKKKEMKKYLKQIIGESNLRVFRSIYKTKKERELIKKRRTFYSQFLTFKDDIYIDVGANYGNRIEPLIGKGLKIIAVEPQLKCVEFLKRKYGNKITIIPKGLGEIEESRTIYISNAHAITSFSKDWIKATQDSGRFSEYTWSQGQEVEMTTLDNLINTYGKPKFIKIDVEGFEYEVLKGLSQDIEFISFEYIVPERINSVFQCLDRISEIANQNNVLFNYSKGESMEWALDEWILPYEMKKEVKLDRFIKSRFGDIYSKTTANKG